MVLYIMKWDIHPDKAEAYMRVGPKAQSSAPWLYQELLSFARTDRLLEPPRWRSPMNSTI